MDDFTSNPGVPNSFGLVQGKANEIEPGKRPLSSMAPTIVLRGQRLFMVRGSSGGSTIISTTLESISNVIDFGMNVHQQGYPGGVFAEPGLMTRQTRRRLRELVYRFRMLRS